MTTMTALQQAIRLSFPISWPKWLGYTVGFAILSVVLPIGFHQMGLGGRQFLPMHIPALLAGFLAGPWSGIVVGLLGPALSQSMTGMPPADRVALMSVELAVYGLISGIAYYQLRLNVFIALITAMIGGRLVFGFMLWIMGTFFGGAPYTAASWFSAGSAMITGLPGIIAQLVIIPLIVAGVKRTKRKS